MRYVIVDETTYASLPRSTIIGLDLIFVKGDNDLYTTVKNRYDTNKFVNIPLSTVFSAIEKYEEEENKVDLRKEPLLLASNSVTLSWPNGEFNVVKAQKEKVIVDDDGHYRSIDGKDLEDDEYIVERWVIY